MEKSCNRKMLHIELIHDRNKSTDKSERVKDGESANVMGVGLVSQLFRLHYYQ
ncbi:hypothetical protein DPMN_009425 [Dreissena polymorpha]|uniref:Uncharacterized protein n=1 Tax=Dreissena polymorpha TaxID=45954 RepID=A0A9D4N255_DREPO|nr:hypothetical protein DPMN_009425 [Dreissena polymorpha]